MTYFSSELRLRAAEARRALTEARESDDDYLTEIRLGELESLRRLAADHHIDLEDNEGSMAG